MPNHGRSVLANIDRLNAFMDRNGLAAVAVRTGVNFTYLSGMAMPGTLARHLDIASTVRGFMVLWPRHGAPVIVLDAFAEKLARRESWIAQVEVYQAYEKSLYSRVAELIAENTSLRAASTSASSPSISRCAVAYASVSSASDCSARAALSMLG